MLFWRYTKNLECLTSKMAKLSTIEGFSIKFNWTVVDILNKVIWFFLFELSKRPSHTAWKDTLKGVDQITVRSIIRTTFWQKETRFFVGIGGFCDILWLWFLESWTKWPNFRSVSSKTWSTAGAKRILKFCSGFQGFEFLWFFFSFQWWFTP